MKCSPLCEIYTGGEIKHDTSCPFYPESLTEMYDEMKENLRMSQQYLYDTVTGVNTEEFANGTGIWPPLPDDYWLWYCKEKGITDILLKRKK